MPIVKCPSCRRRYDPGIEIPDDLSDEASMVVCCPACGQWVTLPEREPADPPDVPRHVREQMRRQARLVDEDDDDRPSRRSRRRRDEEDDDRPSRRRARDEDDDLDDDRPIRRRGKKSGLPLPWIIGGAVALVLLLGCGIGGFLMFSKGGGPITISQASRQPAGFRATADTIEIHFTASSGAKSGTRYRVFARCQGRTSVMIRDMDIQPNSTGRVSWTATELAGTSGPVEVWFEEVGGRRASNVFTIR
jgi:hypothetical protein